VGEWRPVPAGFGRLGGDLLVGHAGNGHINAFDLTTGAYVGTLLDDSNLDQGLVQQVLTELNTAQKSVAPFSTPLAKLFTQTAADVQTRVTGLSTPANNLEANERHLTADVETLDFVFIDLELNPIL
jgi:hypothetical protein